VNARFRSALDHDFADPELLRQALTHPSAPGREDRAFERLEFLGDRVLGVVVAEMLLERFPQVDEGGLGRRLSVLVSRQSLVRVAAATGLDEAVARARDSGAGGGRMAETVAADACEAVIAALFLDGGLDAARRFVRRHWRALVECHAEIEPDARTRLQEWSHARTLGQPVYTVRSRCGPAHRPVFEVEAALANGERATGSGGSKRAAAAAAAAALLARIA